MDPYKALGVSRDASDSAIKQAYRKLAKEAHPDVNPGDASVAEKFKSVTAAYDLLGDKKKRQRFDNGEIDSDGRDRAPQFRHQRAGAGAGQPFEFGGFGGFGGFGDTEGLFARFFTDRQAAPQKKTDTNRTYPVNISFLDAARGTKPEITLAAGKKLKINIPAGIDEGQSIRLKNQGEPGIQGGPNGDAILKVHIVPHPYFTRNGDNIYVDVPVTLAEAVGGAKIEVPTIDGAVTVSIPKKSNSGNVLRLKGRGIKLAKSKQRGDQFIKLVVTLSGQTDAEFERFASEWEGDHPYDVRSSFSES